MLMYLRVISPTEVHPELSRKETFTPEGLDEASPLSCGAVPCVRPKSFMTVAVIIAGLLPMFFRGTGAQVQKS